MNITKSQRQRRCTANSQATSDMPIALPAKTKQRKPSMTVEDIYLNRLWQSQMPKEKALDSILESPMPDQHGGKPSKRVRSLKFNDAPNRTKLRQRQQKAVKNGWKPLTKKHSALLDSQLACKLAEIESVFSEANVDNKNDSCLPIENATLQEHDANMPSGVSTANCAATECIENVADHTTQLSAGFQYDTYTQQMRIDACGDADVSVSLFQRQKNSSTESYDENKNTLNDILCENDCQVKMELLKSNTKLCQDGCDFSLSGTDSTVHCGMNNTTSPTAECLPSSVKRNISECKQQKKVVMKKNKQSKSHRVRDGMHSILEQHNERHVYSEPDAMSVVEEHNKSAENTAVQVQGNSAMASLKLMAMDLKPQKS